MIGSKQTYEYILAPVEEELCRIIEDANSNSNLRQGYLPNNTDKKKTTNHYADVAADKEVSEEIKAGSLEHVVINNNTNPARRLLNIILEGVVFSKVDGNLKNVNDDDLLPIPKVCYHCVLVYVQDLITHHFSCPY